MDQSPRSASTIGLIVAVVLVLAATVFFFTGGGVKEVTSDADLPPVASPEKK